MPNNFTDLGNVFKRNKRPSFNSFSAKGSETDFNLQAEIQANPRAKVLVSYFNQFGEFPVSDLNLEGNLELFDQFSARLGGQMVNTPNGAQFGGKLGLQFRPTKNTSVEGSVQRRPGSSEPNFGLKFTKRF